MHNQKETIVSQEQIIRSGLRGIVLVIIGSLIMACATSTSPVAYEQPGETQIKSVFETCAVVQDQELDEMRGCYDVYSFGMSIKGDLDLASKKFAIQTNYTQIVNSSNMPSDLKVNSTGSQVAFNDGRVSFMAGIGQNSLGSGIMQVVQVAGSNVIVVANLDVTLNINNSVSIGTGSGTPAANALRSPSSLAGILR
jgi:hypothetical protein